MRSLQAVGRIVLLAIFVAGSVSGSSDTATPITLYVGEEFEAAVPTFFEDVEKCFIQSPNDRIIEFKPTDNSDEKHQLLEDREFILCRAIVRNVDVEDNGLWTLTFVSPTGVTRSQSYEVTVNTRPETTTESSEDDTEKRIEYLTEERFDTTMGAKHNVIIPQYDFVSNERCLVIRPDGLQVDLQSAKISGIEIITDPEVACGISINVDSEEVVGRWFLVSRGTRYSTEIFERRLPFTISVEETVYAMPRELSVVEGNDFYVRLDQPSNNPESCKLLRPDGNEHEWYDTDSRYVDTCGFIIRNANTTDSGKWQIVHGNRTIYRASIQVTVTRNGGQASNLNYVWTRDQPVQEIFGPESAIYCKVVDPRDFVVFEGFGRCNVTLPRATSDLDGIWKMFVGLNGRVLTEETSFRVVIAEASPKERVQVSVAQNKPIVTLSCNISTQYPVTSCKFRAPTGQILMANPGVGEDRFTFHGQGSSYESGVHTHDCGIQITNPQNRDLGLWRCAVETTKDTYYGFVPVLCPWAMRDPEVAAAVVSEPTLTADRQTVSALEGDSVLMSCSVESAIRYCYFRTRNGTIFNVGPGGSSSDMASYAGEGLDSGECSIRFRSLTVNDTGAWSCHVGFEEPDMPEQRVGFTVNIQELMSVSQRQESNGLLIRASVQGRELDYCRFVRIDGLGFTGDAVPGPYVGVMNLNVGECSIWIHEPTILERHPWTIVARIKGQGSEISRSTEHSLEMPGSDNPDGPILVIYRTPTLAVVLMICGLTLIASAVLVGSKKNRRWVYDRASHVRSSFRNSFAKKAVNEQNIGEKNTANAA